MDYQDQESQWERMEELKKKREAHEDSLAFVDFLKLKYDELERLSHRDKSNISFDKAQEISRRVISRCVHEKGLLWDRLQEDKLVWQLHKSEQILRKYKYNGSDKNKREIIKEFVEEFTYDLQNLIMKVNNK